MALLGGLRGGYEGKFLSFMLKKKEMCVQCTYLRLEHDNRRRLFFLLQEI